MKQELWHFANDEDMPENLRRAFARELKAGAKKRRDKRGHTDQEGLRRERKSGAVRRMDATDRPGR